MFFDTLRLLAETESFPLAFVEDEFFREVFDDLVLHGIEFLQVEFLDALVLVEVSSLEFSVAHLAHDFHCRAVVLDVV